MYLAEGCMLNNTIDLLLKSFHHINKLIYIGRLRFMQEEEQVPVGKRRQLHFILDLISKFWIIFTGSVAAAIGILALVLNSELDYSISFKLLYTAIPAIIIIILVQIIYNYYKKSIDFSSGSFISRVWIFAGLLLISSISILVLNLDLDQIITLKLRYAVLPMLIIITFAQIIYNYHKKYTKIKPETLKFYEKLIKEPTRIIHPYMDVDPLKKGTQAFDWQGILELKDFFREKFGIRLWVIKSDTVSEGEKTQNNLICVGGGNPNQISAELASKEEIIYRFMGDKLKGEAIIDTSNNEPIIAFDPEIFKKRNSPIQDYGIITRMKNCYNPERDAIILNGYLGWGTKACIRVLLDEKNMKQLSKHRYFQVLCVVDIDSGGVINNPKLINNTLRELDY
jgi:hypothetical protein